MLTRAAVGIASLLALTCGACGGKSGSAPEGAGATGGAGGGPAEEPPRPLLVVYRLAYGNGRFVATGWREGEDSVIYTSPNGSDWEQLLDLGPYSLGGLAFGNGRFVMAAGIGVEKRTLVSEDGLNWHEFPDQGPLGGSIAFGNRVFVTPGVQRILRSTDGETWEGFETGADDSDVAFAAGSFYKWGSEVRSLSVSATGEEWASAALPAEVMPGVQLNHAFGSKDGLVGWTGGAGYDDAPGGFGTLEPSGGSWSYTTGLRQQALLPVIVTDDACVAMAPDAVRFASGPRCDLLHELGLAVAGETALVEDGIYLVAGMFGILTSQDGQFWTHTLE